MKRRRLHRPSWLVVDWRFFVAIAVALAAGAIFVAVFQLSEGQDDEAGKSKSLGEAVASQQVQIDRLSYELDCRSRAASIGTVANLDLTSATGRGLALFVAAGSEDPELIALVAERLGYTPEVLRDQVAAVLDASQRAEDAKAERVGSETDCAQEAREEIPPARSRPPK